MDCNSKKIIFESHATSLDNEKLLASGWLDSPLSQKGIDQAKELGLRYKAEDFSRIYVSDLSRSSKTAQIGFCNRDMPIIKDARLREWNYGQFNGFSTLEVDTLKIEHIKTPFPSGESLEQAISRFLSFYEACLQSTKSGTILIIGHRATYYALEFLFKKIALKTLLTTPWKWQPGWHYYLSEKF
jgi:2,3-bisphosphoglycerate-dependent phosphoglycerate mutase